MKRSLAQRRTRQFHSARLKIAAVLAVILSVNGLSAASALEKIEAQPVPANLVAYEIVNQSIPKPLTQQNGNSKRGLEAVLDRARGHCLLCHTVSTINEPSQGNIGPALDGVGTRLSAAALRLRLVDGTKINANTAMPAYYRTVGLHQVTPAYRNQPVLTAQEIEDVVAWLTTLGGLDDH